MKGSLFCGHMQLRTFSRITSDINCGVCNCWYLDARGADLCSVRLSARQTLSQGEYYRGLNRANESESIESWSSGLVVRFALSQYVQNAIEPGNWKISRLDSGKPVVANSGRALENIRFSIAHSDGLVLCIVGTGLSVGVDLESINRTINTETINSRIFTADELRLLMSRSNVERQELALRLWTAKEAFSKAYGGGLSMDYSAFNFKVIDSVGNQGLAVKSIGLKEGWQFQHAVLLNQYFVSVATVPLSASG